ncbi:MAG: 4Fe-4S binding protein [Acidiferrobacteraceae bacterium]
MSSIVENSSAVQSGNARARSLALEKVRSLGATATSPVDYHSAGRLLILGDASRAVPLAKRLRESLQCTYLNSHEPEAEGVIVHGDADGIRVVVADLTGLDGYLGAFTATVREREQEANLAQLLGAGDEYFDLVLDLGMPPRVDREILPPGYFAPGEDEAAVTRAVEDLPGLIGEFEKPKYFQYNPDICAHGASGMEACSRCLDACPTEAIASVGDRVAVDPYLCQGGGSCATVCPSGAMSFTYPAVRDLLEKVRAVSRHFHEAGGRDPVILFHDPTTARSLPDDVGRVPGHIIPIEVEEIGAVGIDAWLASLAYGFCQVLLLVPPAIPPRIRHALQEQMLYAGAVLEGIGYSANRIRLVESPVDKDLLAQLQSLTPEPGIQPASFAPMDEKRTILRLAIDHLYRHAPAPVSVAPVPAGASFGEILVDQDACTLCMACVGVCPTMALSDGHDVPQLRFDEWNCVQCGLCESACPEEAITRNPRFIYDPELRRRTRVLNEDEPFFCVSCGKPFATRSVMDKMAKKLKDHYMFQTLEAKRRMRMCEDCRVRDLFRKEAGGAGPKLGAH